MSTQKRSTRKADGKRFRYWSQPLLAGPSTGADTRVVHVADRQANQTVVTALANNWSHAKVVGEHACELLQSLHMGDSQ